MAAFERLSAYDGGTLKPAIGMAISWPIVWLQVAVKNRSPDRVG